MPKTKIFTESRWGTELSRNSIRVCTSDRDLFLGIDCTTSEHD